VRCRDGNADLDKLGEIVAAAVSRALVGAADNDARWLNECAS